MVLRSALSPGASVVCYADDTVVVTGGGLGGGERHSRASGGLRHPHYSRPRSEAPSKCEAAFFNDGSHGRLPWTDVLVESIRVPI